MPWALRRQLVAAADVADDLAQVRLGLQQCPAVGDETAQHGAVALQQPVGEFDHVGIRPAVLAQAQQPEESRFLLAGCMLGHEDGRRGSRARDAGMAMHQDVTAGTGMDLFAELQDPGDMVRRAGFEARVFGDDIVEADQLVVDFEEVVEGRGPRVKVEACRAEG